jgi:UDP-GlcNAc:undecaprenyl-phosphate GlcNAc-1-phosphate transferase
MNEIILVLSFMLSFFLTIYGTPVAQKVAHQYKILDYPDQKLKQQEKPIPYLGGIIIYFAFISPVSLLFPFNKKLLGILFASSILLIVGLFDDLKALTPIIKLLFQIIATFILIRSGIMINLTFLNPWVNQILSFIWIISMINAINIIDIMDGLATSITALAAMTIFVISLYNQQFLISILSISLAGALFGFLKFNWEPAKIYLGDSGSMFIGMVIGSLTILGDYSRYNDLAFISGFLILAIPIFDMIYVMILRVIHKRSPFIGSRDHFALRLKKKLKLTNSRTVCIIFAAQMVLAGMVIFNFFTTIQMTIISTLSVVIIFTLAGFWLGDERMNTR